MRRLPLVTALVTAALLALSCGTALPALARTPAAEPTPPAVEPQSTDADADIVRLGQQAEALSDQYFEALGRLAEIRRRIDDIEARIPALSAEVTALRDRTRDRAVAAYVRSGRDLSAVVGAGDPLDAARRIRWLDRLNAADDDLTAELKATSARLAAERADLHAADAADAAAATALDSVQAQGRAIDALLLDAQARRRAATATATTPTNDGGTATDGPVGTPVATGPPTTTANRAPATPPSTAPPSYSPTPGTHPHHDEPFLVCTRTREASGNYAAYNAAGPYMGAYQFLQSSWNSAASHAGRPELVGVPPHTASAYDQDDVAWALYQWRGSAPWGGMCDPG